MKKTLLLAFFLLVCTFSYASHLRSGVITFERTSCLNNGVKITLTVYTNTSSSVAFGGDGLLDFGDGSNPILVPETAAIPRPDLGPNIGVAIFTYTYLYSMDGIYLISYNEPNRNAGILNMANSFQTEFCLKSNLVLGAVCVNSPQPTFAPVFQAALGSQFSVSLGSFAGGENEFLTYEKVVPARDRNLPVIGYESPETFQVNRLNGLVTWDTDAQDTPGEYTFAVKISKFVLLNDEFVFMGYVIVDFEVILSEQSGNNFVHDNELLDEYNRIEVSQGEEKTIRVFYESESASPSLTVYSELAEDLFSFTQYDSTHEGRNIKVAVVTVEPDASAIRSQPYLLTVRGKTSVSYEVSDINYLIYTDDIQEIPVYTGLEKDVANIQVFPNPTREKITIQLNRPGLSQVFFYSLQGTLVRRKTFEIETNVELHELASGIYICEVRRDNAVVQRIKVVKQ
jgi:Secretion system C-terminal sorting domain